MRAAREEAAEEQEREDGELVAASELEAQRRQDAGREPLDEHRRDDDGAAPARVDQPPGCHPHEHRGACIRRVEERQGADAQRLGEGRHEGEEGARAEPEDERDQHRPLDHEVHAALQRRQPPRGGVDVPAALGDPPDERDRDAREQGGEHEEPPKPVAGHRPLAGQRRQRGRRESRHAVDAEGPAPALDRHEVDRHRVVRDEEGRIPDSLQEAQDAEHAHGVAHERDELGHDHGGGAEAHERPAPEGVDPGSHQRLADDPGGAVEPHHDADLDFGSAQALDVERQEQEAVEAREEEEVCERGPDEQRVVYNRRHGGSLSHADRAGADAARRGRDWRVRPCS